MKDSASSPLLCIFLRLLLRPNLSHFATIGIVVLLVVAVMAATVVRCFDDGQFARQDVVDHHRSGYLSSSEGI